MLVPFTNENIIIFMFPSFWHSILILTQFPVVLCCNVIEH